MFYTDRPARGRQPSVGLASEDLARQMTSPRTLRPVPESNPLLEHLDALPAAVIEVDEQGVIRAWSGGAERLFGWTREEVLGRALSMLELRG